MTEFTPGVQKYIERGQALMNAAAAARERMRQMKFDTIATHGLYNAEAAYANQGSVIEPAYLSTSQHFENSDHLEAGLAYLMPAWTYSRIANPTVGYLEETLALLEGYGGEDEVTATVTSSGMSAVFMATNPFLALTEVQPGTNGHISRKRMNIVVSARCYGGTFMLFQQRYGVERGIDIRWVRDPLNLDEWASLIDEDTRFLYGEMPTNPTLDVMDIPAVAALAHTHQLPLIIDPTVATPALLRPLTLGADIVVQSVTKSLATSGLAIAGAIIARHNIPSRVGPDALRENFALYVKLLPLRDHGPGLSPFNALLILNDIRTLRMRMDTISQASQQIADFLAQHPQVEQVYYPAMPGMAGSDIARRDMRLVDSETEAERQGVNRYGQLLSFTVKGGISATRAVYDRLELIFRATDLGRIKSVATIPAISTHQQQGEEGRELGGVPGNLIRLNVGAEHPADLIADLDRALRGVRTAVIPPLQSA